MALFLIPLLETSPTNALPQPGTPIWVPLLLVGLVLLLLWWGLTRGQVFDENVPRHVAAAPAHGGAHAAHPVEAAPHVDDLEQIEGIGPVIAGVLAAHGIHTFAELAAADTTGLVTILREAGLNMADPGTWPEQAQLAASGQLEAFATLKETLRAGKREH